MTRPELKKYVVTRELKYEVWAYSEADALAFASQRMSLGWPVAALAPKQIDIKEVAI